LTTVPDILRELKSQIETLQMSQVDTNAPIVDIIDYATTLNFVTDITATEDYICDSFVLGHTTNGLLGMGVILEGFDS
jgi:hypothetical protein